MKMQEEQFNELVEAIKSALEAMEKAELEISALRVEVDYWKQKAINNG